MTNYLKNQFDKEKQEKDPILRLEKLKALRNKIVLLILNETIEPEKNETTQLEKLLDPKSICKN